MVEANSTILIVDDDADDLALVERALRSIAELHSIKDPHEVIPCVHQRRPDVVVLDALLPGLSGFDLCKQIKAHPELKTTQVLILTGVYLRQQYRNEATQQFKADAFLTKPFRPPELQRLVVQLLAKKTRMPQSGFLKRIGLPASSSRKKRSVWGRLFGREEAEPVTVRIAPIAREVAPAPEASVPAAQPVKPVETVETVEPVEPVEKDTGIAPPPAEEPAPRSDGEEETSKKTEPTPSLGTQTPEAEAVPPLKEEPNAESTGNQPETVAPPPESTSEPAVEATASADDESRPELQASPPEDTPRETVVPTGAAAAVADAEPAPETAAVAAGSPPSGATPVTPSSSGGAPSSGEEAGPLAPPEREPAFAPGAETVSRIPEAEKSSEPDSSPRTISYRAPGSDSKQDESSEAASLARDAADEPTAVEELAAPPPIETEAVTWILAESRTRELSLDEAVARAAGPEGTLERLSDGDEEEPHFEAATVAFVSASPDSVKAPESPKSLEPAATPASVDVTEPVEASEPVEAPEPVEASEPVEAPEPVEAVEAPEPVEASEAVEAPEPVEASEAVEAPEPVEASEAVEAPEPVEATGPIEAPEPVEKSGPLAPREPVETSLSQPLQRPRFRIGEVPIYDEPDFLTELKRELSKCKRVDRPLTLILIRVGDLSQIVELFGKEYREPVLWHVAEQAMACLREVDLVGMMSSRDLVAMTAFASDRYGGGRIVSRMRQAVGKRPFRVGEELPPIIPVLEFGMAAFPEDGNEPSALMERAENELSERERSPEREGSSGRRS